MKRDVAIALVVVGWSGLLVLVSALVDAPQRCENSVLLMGGGVALLLGSGALGRVYAARHSQLTGGLGRALFIAFGAVSLLLGLVGAISQC